MELRRAGLSRRQIRDRLHVDNNDVLNRLLQGEPAPEWTRRPNAKDDLREKARELRRQGWTYDRIQVELGCSKCAERYWADMVGVDVSAFRKTTLKKHKAKTVRKNVGDGYRGCLVISVLQGAELYRRIEGWWYGIVGAVRPGDPSNRT